jgi:hypothetical protein
VTAGACITTIANPSAAASRTEWRSQAPSNIVAPLAANALFDLNPSCVDMLR